MLQFESSITIDGDNFDVVVKISSAIPGDPGVHTYPNGDPGYPPSDPEVEFTVYDEDEKDITSKVSDEDIVRLEGEAFNYLGSRAEDAAISAYEDRMEQYGY